MCDKCITRSDHSVAEPHMPNLYSLLLSTAEPSASGLSNNTVPVAFLFPRPRLEPDPQKTHHPCRLLHLTMWSVAITIIYFLIYYL